ncbi:MAG: hypothetical protein B6U87_00450 [Candidatus Aenigmarchaeota archaeon ex4484_52]|nr:MAG: hypothetical protein B6U87_00450 [Candidatus Aenigmarchaeota archaeon ex4484_52]
MKQKNSKRKKITKEETALDLKKKLIKKGLIKQQQKNKKSFFEELNSFFESSLIALYEFAKTKNINIFLNAFFIDLIKSYPFIFEPLKKKIIASNISEIPEEYITKTMSVSVFAFFLFFVVEFIKNFFFFSFYENSIYLLIFDLAIIPTLCTIFIGIIFYFEPFIIANKRKKSIETNMPFAIDHLSAIVSTGIPPEIAFKMVVEYSSYGEFGVEIKKIINRMNSFGEDINKSMSFVLKNTPSEKFREFIYGMISVLEGGGNINEYLNEMSNVAMFDYKIKRKKYLADLSSFADIYTILLIAAPFFIIAILTIMNLVPDAMIFGMDIISVMKFTIYGIIPIFNILFIVSLYVFQPEE